MKTNQNNQDPKKDSKKVFSDNFLSTSLPDELTNISQSQFNDNRQQILNSTIPSNNHNFDEKEFLELLADSISLTLEEKLQIIKAIPSLSQKQINELIEILKEEKTKFEELNKKHERTLKEMKQKQQEELKELESKADKLEREKEEKEEIDQIIQSIDNIED